MDNGIIELKSLCDMGKARAKVTDSFVHIELEGINGALKAWLIGAGDAIPLGNLVDGKIEKKIDTTHHSGILITQSGRQMFLGYYKRDESGSSPQAPFFKDSFSWTKVTTKKYTTKNCSVKYILSNTPIYENFKKYSHYYLGEGKESFALALKCSDEENPFSFLKVTPPIINGYRTLIIDEKKGEIKGHN